MEKEKSVEEMFRDLQKQLSDVLETLPEMEKNILISRFGLCDGIEHSYDELSEMFNLSEDDIISIEQTSLRKMRHPKSK